MSAIFTDVSGVVRLEGTLRGATMAADAPQWAALAVTSPQILALFTTSLTLVAAPGAGKILVPHSGFISYTAGAVQYATAGGYLHVNYPGMSKAPGERVLLGVQATDLFGVDIGGGSRVGHFDHEAAWSILAADAINAALVFGASGENPTAGNGTLVVAVLYSVYTL